MTDVKIEAAAWMSDDGRLFKSESEARRNSWNGAFPLYDHATIAALQERIAELTNANLRMLGERDRARIAEGEVARARIWADWLERQDDSAEFDPVGLAHDLRKALAGES